jgi:hypothetical protein
MSCLFNSLNAFIQEGSYEIRQKICNYLQENKPIIDGLDTDFILALENGNYIEQMRSPSTWGGAIEIQVACNLWHMQVYVKNYRNQGMKDIEFLPLNGQYEKTIHVYWTGGHYEPTF